MSLVVIALDFLGGRGHQVGWIIRSKGVAEPPKVLTFRFKSLRGSHPQTYLHYRAYLLPGFLQRHHHLWVVQERLTRTEPTHISISTTDAETIQRIYILVNPEKVPKDRINPRSLKPPPINRATQSTGPPSISLLGWWWALAIECDVRVF